ncbi:MAG: flagellar export chaperone FliS [Myxococcota bacterium]
MLNPAINRYKTVQVKTSSPGDLLMLLFDGCFRFLGESVVAMERGDRAKAGERLDRAHAIVGELTSTLRHEVWPELCENLEGVYLFSMGHLVKANLEQDPALVREVMSILEPVREGFREAVAEVKARGGSGGSTPR